MFAAVNIVILSLLAYAISQRSPTRVPLYDKSPGDRCGKNNERVCVPIFNCPEAVKTLKTNASHGLERCGFQGIYEVVCCEDPVQSRKPIFENKTVAACRRYFKEYDINKLNPFILDGENATLGQFPYVAALGYPDTDGEILLSNKTVWRCGGTLISESYILTAAHCIVAPMGNELPKIVRLGKIDIEGDEDGVQAQDIPVSNATIYPDFNFLTRINDVALLKLAWPANFTDYVKPVCLSTDDKIPANLILAGWGAVETENYTTSRFLQKAHTTLYDLNKCIDKFSKPVKVDINSNQFCALSDTPAEGRMRQDACKGDSGGPITYENTKNNGKTPAVLVGVISYGRGCGGSMPSIYTKVSKFINWIEDIVWSDI